MPSTSPTLTLTVTLSACYPPAFLPSHPLIPGILAPSRRFEAAVKIEAINEPADQPEEAPAVGEAPARGIVQRAAGSSPSARLRHKKSR